MELAERNLAHVRAKRTKMKFLSSRSLAIEQNSVGNFA